MMVGANAKDIADSRARPHVTEISNVSGDLERAMRKRLVSEECRSPNASIR